MSSGIIENDSYIKIDSEDNNNNNEINKFSRNFNKCYKNLKDSQEKNNKKNNSNENDANNKLSNTTSKANNSIVLNSLAEFDLINIPQIEKTKNNSKRKVQASKKSPPKGNNPYLHLSSSSRDNLISSTNPIMVQTTTVQSAQIQNIKNKYLKSQKIKPKLKLKSKSLKNLKKCSFSQAKFDSFLERLKENEKKKEKHINNIRCKSLENEKKETNTNIKINKKSLTLLKNKKRKPLYQKKPMNEEPYLEKNFQNFYEKTLRESQSSKIFIKSKKNNKKNLDDKYNKFYEDKIKWKNNVEQKNKNRKLNINQEFENYIDNFPFKPSLDKNSLNIANKLNRQRSTEHLAINNFYETGNDRGTLNKFKAKLKPILSNFNNNYNYFPVINKKNHTFKRTLSEMILKTNKNNDFEENIKNKNNKKVKNKQKSKINYKLTEKKYINQNKKIENDKIYDGIYDKNSYLLRKLEEAQIKKKLKSAKTDLYKLNIRPGTAWNQEVINKIKPLKECDEIIEGLL